MNAFDWKSYVSKYPDLQKAGINTNQKAWKHWITYGKKEGRTYQNNKLNDDTNIINIIYQVDSTSKYPYNTGIQRLVRLLGKYLDQKYNIYLVKFDNKSLRFVDINDSERKWMETFNGIPFKYKNLDMSVPNKWLLNAEICYDLPSVKPMFDVARLYNMKIATIFYDDIQYKMNNNWSPNDYNLFNLFIQHILEADLIFPISLYSYKQLLYHVNKININNTQTRKIVPCVLPGEFPGLSRNYTYNFSFSPPCDKYRILCVGIVNLRKNQIKLLQAINTLKNKYNIEVILVGPIVKTDKYYPEILHLMKSNKIIHYDNVITDDELRNLYLSSHLTVFPSIEEGFGLPILESLWNCRPCICMNYGAMDEIATSGCLKIDCNNADQIAITIDKFLSNEDLRKKLINEIINIKFRTWTEYADDIMKNIISFNNF